MGESLVELKRKIKAIRGCILKLKRLLGLDITSHFREAVETEIEVLGMVLTEHEEEMKYYRKLTCRLDVPPSQCPQCGGKSEWISTFSEWCGACDSCDIRFNKRGEIQDPDRFSTRVRKEKEKQ